jgi:hypothetical protein
MADLLATISSNYVAMGSLYATAGKKYVNVDPAAFEGTWRGKYSDGKSFSIGVSNVNGFRATARYESSGVVKYQNVLIASDNTFRVGDAKFTLTRPGTAQIKTVMMKDGQPSTIETAYAKQNG